MANTEIFPFVLFGPRPPKRTCGIYAIHCIDKMHSYVGGSTCIASRISNHLFLLKKSKHFSDKLSSHYKELNPSSFIFEILELCEVSKLPERETFWYDEVAKSKTLYNANPPPLRLAGYKRPDIGSAIKAFYSNDESKREALSEKVKQRFIKDPSLRFRVGSSARGKKQSRSQVEKRMISMKETYKKIGRPYMLRSPDGKIFCGRDFASFCSANGLDGSAVGRVIDGLRSNHKGWTMPLPLQ